MAVVQISRIQIRRGQKNQGLGLPQLASGELGWAIDTQELYIGNGSVAEGAPAVGNTKVLTQYDDILELARAYSYKAREPYIVTGPSSVGQHGRTIQERLDDRVSVKAFGITGDSTQNVTTLLQQAIDQLYINNTTKFSERSRVILYFEAGVYSINDTITLPPYTSLVGEGPEKTVIRQVSNVPAFRTVNDLSTPDGGPADSSTNTINNQARQILIKGMTIKNDANGSGIILEDCRDSLFSDLDFIGSWDMGESIPPNFDSNIGIEFISLSTNAVKTKNNHFINCRIKNWSYGIHSSYDIENIKIDKCYFEDCGYAITYGVNMNLGAEGQSQGARQSAITNCVFNEISNYAIWIENGTNNSSKDNQFLNVGNTGSDEGGPTTAIIKFREVGNNSTGDYFRRTEYLSYNDSYINSPTPFIPEIEGPIFAEFDKAHTKTFSQSPTFLEQGVYVSYTRLFRLAGYANQTYKIKYQIVGRNSFTVKTGELTVHSGLGLTSQITLTDEYDFAGDIDNEDLLNFSVRFVDADSIGGYDTIAVNVTNPIADTFDIQYKVSIQKTE